MTKEEAKRFGLQLLHRIMERNGSYPVYANNVKQAIEALSEPDGSSEIPNDLEEAAKAYADDTNPTDSFYEAFKEGALWMREKMMKEAVEGEIMTTGFSTCDPVFIINRSELSPEMSFKDGDKVRIIIVKEG